MFNDQQQHFKQTERTNSRKMRDLLREFYDFENRRSQNYLGIQPPQGIAPPQGIQPQRGIEPPLGIFPGQGIQPTEGWRRFQIELERLRGQRFLDSLRSEKFIPYTNELERFRVK